MKRCQSTCGQPWGCVFGCPEQSKYKGKRFYPCFFVPTKDRLGGVLERLPNSPLFSDLGQRLDEDFWRLVGDVR